MNIDQQSIGLMMSLGNFVSMTSTWLLMPLLNKWSLRRVGISVLLYTALATAGAFFVTEKYSLFIWGALIGGTISTLGSLSNMFVQSSAEPHKQGQLLSILHSLYGLSSLFAPWAAGLILDRPEKWQLLFLSASPVALMFAGFVFRFGGHDPQRKQANKAVAQPMSLNGIHILAASVMIFYVLGETLTSTWMTSYLTTEGKLSILEASRYTSAFFAAMLVTRVICGIWARPRYHRMLIWICLAASFLCFTLGKLTGLFWLIPLTGLIGPFFPLYLTWTSLKFPERDRSLLIWMLSGMQAGLALMNSVVGKLADSYGFKVAFWTPAVMMIITMMLLKFLEIKLSTPHQSS
jgi:fucose permease